MLRYRTKRCRVKDILLQKGMTQQEFANRIGFSKSHISDIVNNRATMKMDTGMVIAKGLNVSMEELYEWEVIVEYKKKN